MSDEEKFGLEDVSRALEVDENVVVSLDIDNPVKKPGPVMEPYEGVKSAIVELMEMADAVTFNSGKPLDYQRQLRKEYSRTHPEVGEIDLIGGLGTTAEIDGEFQHFGKEDIRDFLELQRDLFSRISKHGWKASLQNNRSYDVGVTRLEAEGGSPHSRGKSKANPMFADKNTGEFYEDYFEDTGDFEMDKTFDRDIVGTGAIVAEDSLENLNYLIEIVRIEQPFIGLRYERTGEGKLAFYRDRRDREIDEEKMVEEFREAVEDTDWDLTYHDDGGIEYWKPTSGKTSGLEGYMEHKFGGDAIAVHIGDGRSDLIESEDVITIPQKGTELYEEMGYELDTPGTVAELPDYLKSPKNKVST